MGEQVKRSAHFRISESALSERAKNVLIQIADELVPGYDWISWSRITRQRLLRIKNCGAKTASEILRYGIEHASPKQAARLRRILAHKPCPTCGKLP